MSSQRPIVRRPDADPAALERFPTVDPLLAQVFAQRGVSSERELDYGLRHMAPVGALPHIDDAAELVLAHKDSRIIVVGDFDVDGATSTALILRCLRNFGFADVDYLVPNRFEYGYGLSPQIVEVAAQREPSLLVTVDNGISSVDGVAKANELGIPVLITDHHLPGKQIPDAAVIVNPNLPDSGFPSRNLAGVGVAFYLMARLGRLLQEQGLDGAAKIPARYLDLIALGTVADVVPLDYNNRVLVQQGLARIRAGQMVAGIAALLRTSGRQPTKCVSTDLGFAVGPRINAAGRLEDISIGIECLLSDDDETCNDYAQQLDRINSERRDIEATMRDQAFRIVDELGSQRWPNCVSLYDSSWHQGVVGLIAARVRERCHRPVIAFAREDDHFIKGSARSIPGVHIRDLLEAVSATQPGMIVKFGGHAMAAGLSLAVSDFEAFKLEAARQMKRLYPQADFSGAIVVDGVLPGHSLNLDFARTLRDASPWGSAFPEPTWSGEFHIVEQRTVGGSHLKLRVRAVDSKATIDAIAFNQAGAVHRGVVQMVYRLDVNEFRGVESAQLVVEQIAALRPSAA